MDAHIATEAEIPVAAEVLALAFADDPVMRHMHPVEDGRTELMRVHIEMWLRASRDFSEVWLLGAGAGAPWWISPAMADLEDDPFAAIAAAEADLLGDQLAVYLDSQAVIEAHYTSGEPHWRLEMIGAHPGRRGQGVGSQLMAPMLDMCDREGVPIHASRTSPLNKSFYDRHGFVSVGVYDLPHNGPRLWQIRRPPPAERQPVVTIRTAT